MNSTCNFYPTTPGQTVPCPHCGESRDARFALCIKCQSLLPESLRRSLQGAWKDRNNAGLGYCYSRVIKEALIALRALEPERVGVAGVVGLDARV